jgi:hypothetical protein
MVPSPVRAQSSVEQTTLGKDQNDNRDYVNSLMPGPQRFGKGEKKVQINSAELKSKSLKDATFGGSLLNMGIDDGAPKLDESKLHNAQTETDKDSAASRQQTAATEKESAAAEKQPAAGSQPADSDRVFSNLSVTATLADSLVQQDKAAEEAKTLSTSSDTHINKDQSAGPGDKTSAAASSPEPKPNGDH